MAGGPGTSPGPPCPRPGAAECAHPDRPLPGLVWLHGGAYIMGTLDENDDRLDRMVIELGCAVVSVDWRLAPEHPYPEGLDDAETIWRQVSQDSAAFGLDPARLVLGGASAGAGLAAALCLRLREAGLPQPGLQLLIYPMLDDRIGVHHVGFWASDCERRLAELVERGLDVEMIERSPEGSISLAFFKPNALSGMRVELLDETVREPLEALLRS